MVNDLVVALAFDLRGGQVKGYCLLSFTFDMRSLHSAAEMDFECLL